jgi:hypothetical protein
LPEIASARDGLRPGFGMADDGQQQCGKDGDNRNRHQQFDECECPIPQHNPSFNASELIRFLE